MKIVFFGSSDFSVPVLEFCLKQPQKLLAVITTPDRPKGRGLYMQPNPVKERCNQMSIPTFAPASLKDQEVREKIQSLKPELFVVASYGKLIPESWLTIPAIAPWNIHPSLLPKYRGAAPITWQILDGEKETGVTIALVTKELDAGDIVHQIRIPLDPKETTESLTQRLATLAVRTLEEALEKLRQGKLKSTPQKDSESNYARKLVKEDGYLSLAESAQELIRKIRAFHPWPGSFIGCKERALRIVEADVEPSTSQTESPGTLLDIQPDGSFRIKVGNGVIKLFKVQLPGKRIVTGSEFCNGQRLKPGFVFTSLK